MIRKLLIKLGLSKENPNPRCDTCQKELKNKKEIAYVNYGNHLKKQNPCLKNSDLTYYICVDCFEKEKKPKII